MTPRKTILPPLALCFLPSFVALLLVETLVIVQVTDAHILHGGLRERLAGRTLQVEQYVLCDMRLLLTPLVAKEPDEILLGNDDQDPPFVSSARQRRDTRDIAGAVMLYDPPPPPFDAKAVEAAVRIASSSSSTFGGMN